MLRHTIVATVIGATACAQGGKNDASAVKIYGGTSAANQWPNTAALVVSENGSQSLCSGTLIQPNLVVTAAHCFVDDGTQAAPPISNWTVIFGNDINTGTQVSAIKGNWNPQYKNDPQHDVAYLVLAEPQNVQLIQPATATAEIQALIQPGASATIVGFGTTESKSVGTKYAATTTVGQDQDGAMFIGGNGKDSCQGDSGGPAFGQVNGQWRVFGVTSRGAGCGNGGVYARMYDNLCWVEQDSGIKIPGSQLPCDGGAGATASGPTFGAAAGAVSNDLQALLGPATDSTGTVFEFDIAAPQGVTKVSMCFGPLATCEQTRKEDVGTINASGPNASRAYFITAEPMKLTQPSQITLLGYDANGTLVQARGFMINKAQ